MNKQLEDNVIEYVENWLKNGAGSQTYEVFSKLALMMPLPCTETICVRKNSEQHTDLLTTYRDPQNDWAFGGYYHSIGSAHMLTNYINKHADPEILKLFPKKVINNVKSDHIWWNLKTEETVILRILRKELGFSDELILKLLPTIKFAGLDLTLTARGGEAALIYLLDLTNYQDELKKEIVWMNTDTLINRKNFLQHQVPRVQKALKLLD